VKGLLLSDEDVGKLVSGVVPGLGPLLGLLEVVAQLESGKLDRQCWTWRAPVPPCASSTPRPSSAGRWPSPRREARGKKKDLVAPGDTPLDQLVVELDRFWALVKDPQRTAFHLVAQAEPVGEAQAKALFTGLRERGIPVSEIVVNAVEERASSPAFAGRRGLQAPHVRKFQTFDKAIPVHLVQRRVEAPRGLEGLRPFAKEIAGGRETKALEFGAAEGPPALVRAPSMPPIAAPPLPPTRLIFFVGQGGVGKSSCAAAAAVTLTEKEGPVLLISVDPAHGLSDVLQSRLTDTETQVKGTKGLYARELDVPAGSTRSASAGGRRRRRSSRRSESRRAPIARCSATCSMWSPPAWRTWRRSAC
jgi:arsenite-transporting ATPase